MDVYFKIGNSISSMKDQLIEFDMLRFDLIFEYCIYKNIFTGVVSLPEELEFARKAKENFEEYNKSSSSISKFCNVADARLAYKKKVLCDLKQASEVIAKYKQPSIFSNIYNDPEDAYEGLIEFYSKSLEFLT
jgi:hypothetical protein